MREKSNRHGRTEPQNTYAISVAARSRTFS